MPAAEASLVAFSEPGLAKMDDRKRAANHDHSDSAPPLKKQATSVNGGSKPHPDADMPWKDDLDRFQKDAIWRQMQEYKREKASLDARVKELSKATTYHDDHLRVIDAWYSQLIDEAKTLLGAPREEDKDQASFRSSLQFEDVESFEKHLKSRSDDIRDIISRLVSNTSKAAPEISEIQNQLAKKLADEKVTIADLEKALSEKQQLEERLEAASLRYMVAERKLDRARSLTVAKLEKQYIFGAAKPPGPENAPAREEQSPANGGTPTTERSVDAEDAHIKLAAVSEKQKEQLRKLETDNSSLLTQITDLKVKHSKPTDEDYAHTDLFKQLKSQYEDVVKRINHLEATNVQLREEAEKLRSERIAYRNQVDDETRNNMAEREAQLVRAETDLARIRNARDELLADQQMRKAAQEQEKTAGTKARELADAGQARITSLESEIGRLRLEVEQSKADAPDVEQIPVEELRTKYTKLERQYSMLNTELNSMQTACKKYSSLAAQKVADFSAMEEKVSRLTAEKSKADQKYFAAMKSKESRDQEVRMLRMQNSKSSDIISQLKESESASRSLLANMEKHVSESKEALNSIATKHRVAQQQVTEGTIKIDGLRNQVSELKALSASKDSTLASTSSAHRQAETEIESLKATLADTKKSLENWKTKSLGNSSSEYEMLRSLALCTICRRNFKDTVIKLCGHVFCRDCVEERQSNRMRKCPNCSRSFGNNDYMRITL